MYGHNGPISVKIVKNDKALYLIQIMRKQSAFFFPLTIE